MSVKIMTIVGTRPEIIKLSRVMAELELHFEHILVHTGQNHDYELNEVFFEQLGVRKPDYFLDVTTDSTSVAQTIGNVITKSDAVMEQVKPDAVLLYGDTNSCLSVISAKRRHIPIFHMEAGNRCFDQRVPEDINRKIVDHLSDINMPLTEHARRYLIAEGIKPETIIKTGSTMKELFHHYWPQIEKSNVLTDMQLKPKEFFVVSAHREENIDSEENFANFLHSLNAIGEKYNYPIIVSTHPRTRKKLETVKNIELNKNIRMLKPLGFFEYVKLQLDAACVLSDSGSVTEESSILSFPAVMIRQAHERPEGMDEGTVIMSGLNPQRVLQSIEMAMAHYREAKRSEDRPFRLVVDYDTVNVSKKVARIILSYTDFVNRTVWHKEPKEKE